MDTCSLWWVNFIHGWILGWMMRKSWIQFLTLMNESSSCSHTEPPFIPNCWSYFMKWSSVSKFCSLGFVRLHIERADLADDKSWVRKVFLSKYCTMMIQSSVLLELVSWFQLGFSEFLFLEFSCPLICIAAMLLHVFLVRVSTARLPTPQGP